MGRLQGEKGWLYMRLKEKVNFETGQNQLRLGKLVAIGKVHYQNTLFNLYFDMDSKKTVARVVGNHKEKQKLESLVNNLLEVKNGGGYISIKKLVLFSGIALCLGKPTMLAQASERVENVIDYSKSDDLEYNEEFVGQECILYGKEDVDRLFKSSFVSKEGVLKILREHKDLTPEMRGYVEEFIEAVYAQEPDADMRIFAMNLQRKPLIYTNFDSNNSACFPRENRIWFNNLKKEDIFHELSHFRTLTYGESYVKKNKKARIKVVGNSYVYNYHGSGMREAYCVALNHRIGMADSNYDALYGMECILRSLYPDEMYEIETYNDNDSLKKLFLANGLTSNDYDLFIGTTDTIASIYQDNYLNLDSSLVYSMMRPISTLVMNKCAKENLNYRDYVLEISENIPSSKWRDTITFSLLSAESFGIYPTVDQNGNKIEVNSQEIGPAFDPILQKVVEKEEVGPGVEEITDLLFGEENQNAGFSLEESLYKGEPIGEENEVISSESNIDFLEQDEVPLTVIDNDLLLGEENQNPQFLIEVTGPAYDKDLLSKSEEVEVGPGVEEVTDLLLGEENQNYTSQDGVYDYNPSSMEYKIGSMRR